MVCSSVGLIAHKQYSYRRSGLPCSRACLSSLRYHSNSAFFLVCYRYELLYKSLLLLDHERKPCAFVDRRFKRDLQEERSRAFTAQVRGVLYRSGASGWRLAYVLEVVFKYTKEREMNRMRLPFLFYCAF